MTQYRYSGSLPEDATTYVTREADELLYQSLKNGTFSYVLNSRQTGKSSLRVQTMRRLRESGIACAAIDLSFGGIQNVTPEQWYVDLIDTIQETFDLQIDTEKWWESNHLYSPVTKFRKFLEDILLVRVKEPIVIFVDEIDSVLSLKFPSDDFFAFIRACHNQRVDNPEYNRLTFCLLGVASPSNLISDKKRTPFNIGKAITLRGFKLQEVQPLIQGLEGKVANPQAVMAEILKWTRGQPFLTQKLCQFVIEEDGIFEPRRSEGHEGDKIGFIVKSRIIESWESKDEPEHLRTIRDRILRDEQKAGYLLEMYQRILKASSNSESLISADDTLEQSELQLSGLIIKQEGKLQIYNPIYKSIFDNNWIENELKNLRPYSEAFRAWFTSGCKDDSRLLRGKALKDAEEWAKDKKLSYQDKQFLAASREKEIQSEIDAREKEAQLERERKDKEAAEKANLLLKQANEKAKKRIRVGSIVLLLTLSGAIISGFLANYNVKKITEYSDYLKQLAQTAGDLQNEGANDVAQELFSQAGQSVKVTDQKLKLDMLYTGISYGYQKLKNPKLKEAKEFLEKVTSNNNNTPEGKQINILTLRTKANLSKEEENKKEAINLYQKAINSLNQSQITPFDKNPQAIKIVSKENVEAIHRELIALLDDGGDTNQSQKIAVKQSLTKHYYDELDNLLENRKLEEADIKTGEIMLFVDNKEEQGYLGPADIEKFSCENLKKLDGYWAKHSNGRFGFKKQKEIWKQTGNLLGIRPGDLTEEDEEKFLHFATQVGWYDEEGKLVPYLRLMKAVEEDQTHNNMTTYRYTGTLPSQNGTLPSRSLSISQPQYYILPTLSEYYYFFSRAALCKL
jgi:AAA-like domain/GUN4-like